MRWVWRSLLALAVVVVLALGSGWLWLRTSLPQLEGEIRLSGLSAPVQVVRDAHGVPVISAESEHDAYFALGFVHAQDRLFQMESQRRLGAGRLAELLGARALPIDRVMRTLGLYALARDSLETLSPEALAALEAYADGVNAHLDTRSGAPVPEFALLRHRPEPWTPADSLVWARLMGMQLSGNWRDELLRAAIDEVVPPERRRDLWPEHPDAMQERDAALPPAFAKALLAAVPEALHPVSASNVWAVSGELTASGAPLLANDPHLPFAAPVLWYLAEVRFPGHTVSGATVPGTPFHLLGHNTHVAWGMTTTHSDAQDLFVERLVGEDRYETEDGPRPFETREETLRIRGGEEERLLIRATRNGVVLGFVEGPPEGKVLALAAAALRPDDSTAEAVYRLNRARSWEDFENAMRVYDSPQQNIAFAAVDGTIGMISPGRIPIRAGGDGTRPRPGWTGEYAWTGWIPFEELPRTRDPEEGTVVNANASVAPPDYPHWLADDWPEPYREHRILELLDEGAPFTAEAMARMQLDPVSLGKLGVVRRLLAEDIEATSSRGREALERLRAWDGEMDRDRPEPLIAAAWLREVMRTLFAERLGESFTRWGRIRPATLYRVLDAPEAAAFWCGAPSCAPLLSEALETAVDDLRREHGRSLEKWRWGDAHKAVFHHGVFRFIPVLRGLTAPAIETDGGDFSINRGTFRTWNDAFEHRHGAGLRAVYDLGAPEDSLFMIATGQSGNPLSPHYGDLLVPWRDGEVLRLGRTEDAPGLRRLALLP